MYRYKKKKGKKKERSFNFSQFSCPQCSYLQETVLNGTTHSDGFFFLERCVPCGNVMRTSCVMRPSDVMCAFARELEHFTSLRAKRATSLCEAQHHGGEAAASLYKVRRSPFRVTARGDMFEQNGFWGGLELNTLAFLGADFAIFFAESVFFCFSNC